MTDFYNPYYFVPLNFKAKESTKSKNNAVTYSPGGPQAKATKDAADVPFAQAWDQQKDLSRGNTPIRHDAWLTCQPNNDAPIYSGKIIVKLTTMSPTIVGNQHHLQKAENTPESAKAAVSVSAYTYLGKHALPGSSLRGMISTTVEILSQSNMRVLTNMPYSARSASKPPEALSALGRIESHKVNDRDYLFLRPLKLPVIPSKQDKSGFFPDRKWQNAFGKSSTWLNSLGFYVLGFDRNSISSKREFFLESDNPDSYLHSDNPEDIQFYAASFPCNYSDKTLADALTVSRHVKGNMLLAQGNLSNTSNPPNSHIIRKLKNGELPKSGEIKGIIYALDRKDNSTDFPKTKTKQWFIPYDDIEIAKRPLLPIAPEAIENWNAIAEQRFSESKKDYPVFPKGISKRDSRGNLRPLQHGDIVYFDIEDQENETLPMVTRVSYSSIWRLPIGESHQYFNGYLPFGAGADAGTLSPAEQMFGVVEQAQTVTPVNPLEGSQQGDAQKRCVASRINVGDGISPDEVMLYNERDSREVLLKILSGPKAPSPAMYFKRNNGYLSKSDMSQAHKQGQHAACVPNGWKRYLPRRDLDESAWKGSPGVDQRQDLQMQTQPMAEGNTFYFPIDFENLTAPELTLLLVAIRPEPRFKHRLGLGKPLGLGMVELDVDRLLLIDRCCRYIRDALDEAQGGATARYSAVYSESSDRPHSALAARFPLEYNTGISAKPLAEWYSPERINAEHSLIDRNSLIILRKLGDVNALNPHLKIHYPQTSNQQEADKGYEWFVNNDKAAKKQALPVVSASEQQALPPLSSND